MKWFTWGDDLLDGGYVQVPNLLITRQNQLGISPAELNLILQAAACFRQDNTLSPSGRVLGTRMGIGERQVIRLKKRLMSLGYLECTERTMAGRRITDDWDFSGLTSALRTLVTDRGDIINTPPGDIIDTIEGDLEVTTSHTKDHTTKQTIPKKSYGEFDNVRLTDIERQKLLDRFGEAKTLDLIERLSGYKKSKGKAYRDDYATLLNWSRRDDVPRRPETHQRSLGTVLMQDAEELAAAWKNA